MNKEILTSLRTSFDKPEQMKDLFKKLSSECQAFLFSLPKFSLYYDYYGFDDKEDLSC